MDRHQFRTKWHDYNDGIYFVTICAHNKQHIFGKIESDAVGTRFIASALGDVVERHLNMINDRYKDVEILHHVVMPNHVHLIVSIESQSAGHVTQNIGCLRPSRHGDDVEDFHHNARLSTVIGAFKAGVTREVTNTISENNGSPSGRGRDGMPSGCGRDESPFGRGRDELPSGCGRDESPFGRGRDELPSGCGRDESRPYRVWQSRFHEHIIRDQISFDNIANYIETNVERWASDCYNTR